VRTQICLCCSPRACPRAAAAWLRSTTIFALFALPAGAGVGTYLLELVAHASPSLVSIRSVDEVGCTAGLSKPCCFSSKRSALHASLQAVVIGGALSMSSSAFVLQLLSERKELRWAAAGRQPARHVCRW
jgi:Kef-type K+ transport system membrane component KefB